MGLESKVPTKGDSQGGGSAQCDAAAEGMDELDRMLEEAALESKNRKEAITQKQKAGALKQQQAAQCEARRRAIERLAAPSPQPSVPDAEVERYTKQVRSYCEQLLDETVLDSIERTLAAHTFGSLEAHYEQRPELAAFTLTHELRRLDYAVVSSAGAAPVTSPDEIERLLPLDAPPLADASSPEHFLCRCANQSLFAELLAALQAAWHTPALMTSVRASSCRFTLELHAKRLRAEVQLAVSTLGAGDAPLDLASCDACVGVDLGSRTLTQTVRKPRLHECVVFDEQLRGVAAALAASARATRLCDDALEARSAADVGAVDAADFATRLERFLSDGSETQAGAEPRDRGRPEADAQGGDGGMLKGLFGLPAGS